MDVFIMGCHPDYIEGRQLKKRKKNERSYFFNLADVIMWTPNRYTIRDRPKTDLIVEHGQSLPMLLNSDDSELFIRYIERIAADEQANQPVPMHVYLTDKESGCRSGVNKAHLLDWSIDCANPQTLDSDSYFIMTPRVVPVAPYTSLYKRVPRCRAAS
jgi:hypothetical protein